MIDPGFYLPLVREAEAAGWDTFIVPDSICYPEESDSTYPYTPDGSREFLEDKPFIEPFSLIPALAAVTETIRFTTFVVKLPVRHPVLAAKSATSVAVLSQNRFGLGVLFASGRIVRNVRFAPLRDILEIKEDGSPTIPQEATIERLIREGLAGFAPEAQVVGEETGGTFPSTGLAVAIDPVDGTWSLVNRIETVAVSLGFFRDGKIIVGMILNPVTGELGYTTGQGNARLLQLSMFGEPDAALSLPVEQARPGSVLVNVHPARSSGELIEALYAEWNRGGLRMVRSPGGSPSWALLEAAKGTFVYVNLWGKEPAMAYDLAAGVQLLRASGGEAMDLRGTPIDAVRHGGPFVAGIDMDAPCPVGCTCIDWKREPASPSAR